MLRLPEFEFVEVFKDRTGHWMSKGTVKGNHFVRGGFTEPESGIVFADGMLAMLGQGLTGDLKRNSWAASVTQWAFIRNLAHADDLKLVPKNLTHEDAKLLIGKTDAQERRACATAHARPTSVSHS
jgi:hypothetical protein